MHEQLPVTMSFGSIPRQHSVQIASLLGTVIWESTPTTIYEVLKELQRIRDDLATATGTAGKDLSLREITDTVVAHFGERKRYELLEDECTTLRETCRGLQEINKELEGDVDLLRREHITVSKVPAKALDSRRSVPDTLLGRKAISPPTTSPDTLHGLMEDNYLQAVRRLLSGGYKVGRTTRKKKQKEQMRSRRKPRSKSKKH